MSMKTKLMCLFVMAMILTTTFAVAGDLEGVKVGTGSLRLAGIYQAYFYATNWDNNINVVQKYTAFRTRRARLLLIGTIVPDKVKYLVQVDFTGTPAFLDYKMILLNYIPKTSVTFGRFLPYWTLYMHRSTGKLEFVNYPLVNSRYAMWRQAGLQTATKMDAFSFYVGCFNGADIPNNTNANNNAKDFMFRLDVHPELSGFKLLVGGEYWMGRHFVDPSHDKNNSTFGGFLNLTNDQFRFAGEFLTSTIEEETEDVNGEVADLTSMGFYANAVYCATDWLELLARYDQFDPNTENEAGNLTDEDGESWITLGANFMIQKYNAMISLNLIKKTEEWQVMDNAGEEIDLDNDEAIVQFQIMF